MQWLWETVKVELPSNHLYQLWIHMNSTYKNQNKEKQNSNKQKQQQQRQDMELAWMCVNKCIDKGNIYIYISKHISY